MTQAKTDNDAATALSPNPNEGAVAGLSSLAGKYLTFKLGKEEFGVEILKVREIIGLMDITPVPRVHSAVRGVINLRGRIIPVIELRKKFGMPSREDNELTCIIVVEVDHTDGPVAMGMLVDEVSEVMDIRKDELSATPTMGAAVDGDFILAMARVDERVQVLLNLEKVVSVQDLAVASAAGAAPSTDQEDANAGDPDPHQEAR